MPGLDLISTDDVFLPSKVAGGFELYNMPYLMKAGCYNNEKRQRSISSGVVLIPAVRGVLKKRAVSRRQLERLALACLRSYFRHWKLPDGLPIAAGQCYQVSMKHGSLCTFTETGGFYNLVFRDVRDMYAINRILEGMGKVEGIVKQGTQASEIYAKFGCKVVDELGLYARIAKGDTLNDVRQAILDVDGTTIWSVSDELFLRPSA